MQDPLSVAFVGTSFVAGLLSVLSPCVVPLMPAYLSLISGTSVQELQEGEGTSALRRRVLRGCAGFVAGFSTVFVLMGASATALGRLLLVWRIEVFDLSIGIAQLAGLVVMAMGLHLIGWLPIPALYRSAHWGEHLRPRGFLGTALVGAAFALGWSPCVGPVLGGILTLAGTQDTVYQGMALLAVYSAGLSIPFFLAAWSIGLFFRTFQRMKHHLHRVEVASGVLLLVLGVLMLSNQLAIVNGYFGFLGDWLSKAEELLL